MSRSTRGFGVATITACVLAGVAFAATSAQHKTVNDAAAPLPVAAKAAAKTSTPAPAGPDCAKLRCVALTFDDGPGEYTNQILDELDAAGVKATFFEIGENVGQFPEVVKRQVDDGMVIGDHTWTHPNLSHLGAASQRSQLSRTADALEAAGAPRPTLVRPPYGALNSATKAVAADLGMSLITWNVDSQDWLNRNAQKSRRLIMKEVGNGSIVLMHDIQPSTVKALPQVIADLKQRGYTFVTVPQLIGSPRPGVVYNHGV